ncbi:MAG: radical SAM protein, partial [Candidatus Baldrarchaeia archaeon]
MIIYEEKYAKHLIHPIDRSWEIWRFCPHRFAANIYIGCSHACVYCYARSLRPDYHKRIEVRINAVEIARKELKEWNGRLQPVNLGSATDPYQPAEEKYKLVRGVLEEFHNFNSPCFIATKSDLVLRDIDIISKLSSKKLCAVLFTIITLDRELKKMIEPFSPSVERRLNA